MKPKSLQTAALRNLTLVVIVAAAWQAQAQDTKAPYPNMAPLDQYLMERDAEIVLARSAAPESIYSLDRGARRRTQLRRLQVREW